MAVRGEPMNKMGTDRMKEAGPVIIGGVGGSGTRVIAEILLRLGFYMGNDLNIPRDNLFFTLLFKRPQWYINNSQGNSRGIYQALSLFEKSMLRTSSVHFDDVKVLGSAVLGMSLKGNNYLHADRGFWPVRRLMKGVLSGHVDFSQYAGWGWKEPNSHIYIEYLMKHFSRMKYIHVMRHGIDMAYSSNQQQLFNWGFLFDMEPPSSIGLLPKASLNFWIKANQRAVSLAEKLGEDRFLLVNLDDLCFNRREGMKRIISFLDIPPGDVDMNALCDLVKIPKTIGRYRKQDLSIFTEEEIDSVIKLGFAVDRQ